MGVVPANIIFESQLTYLSDTIPIAILLERVEKVTTVTVKRFDAMDWSKNTHPNFVTYNRYST